MKKKKKAVLIKKERAVQALEGRVLNEDHLESRPKGIYTTALMTLGFPGSEDGNAYGHDLISATQQKCAKCQNREL